MKKEFSAGAVIFKKENNELLFLIIYSDRNKTWGFPKGHIERGETEKEAAAREIKEETGLSDLKFIKGFEERITYETISKIKKYVTYFLCEANNQGILVDSAEISDYKFLPLKKAEQLIKFDNLNVILRKAYDFSRIL
jgi:8-oxo-dGTP pyrophosphatase MutT (NUDIX family)